MLRKKSTIGKILIIILVSFFFSFHITLISCGNASAGDKQGARQDEKTTEETLQKQSAEKTSESETEKETEVEKTYPRQDERERMVRTQIKTRGVNDEEVLAAMRNVPRHLFVPENLRSQAYQDNPLPIGYGQTISQPYIVGLMTELLEIDENSKALEIGTGSGYQAAVLAEITDEVYTIEIVKELYERATSVLNELDYDVKTKHGDGFYGWEEHAPYDAIIVTAAASHIPPPLLQQLDNEGRMVIPVGAPHQVQRLVLVTKDEEGKVKTEDVLTVRFVPLTREVK